MDWNEYGVGKANLKLGLLPPLCGQFDKELAVAVAAAAPAEGPARMYVEVSGGPRPARVPLTLIGREEPGPDDLALAAKGATATSDGELEWEKGCTARAIDGIVSSPRDFEGKRWHSSIAAPHPHWVQVKLPRPARLGRVVIRFADPAAYPTDFQGLVLGPDGKEWREVFAVTGNEDRRTFARDLQPVQTDTFRLVITTSVNPVTPNAAQVSEIELYPPAGQ